MQRSRRGYFYRMGWVINQALRPEAEARETAPFETRIVLSHEQGMIKPLRPESDAREGVRESSLRA